MSFFRGVGYFLEGVGLLFLPGMMRYVIAPFLVSCMLFGLLLLLGSHYLGLVNDWFIAFLPAWLHWLSGAIWLLFYSSFFLLLTYLFIVIGNLFSAPFNSLLSEKIEFATTHQALPSRSLSQQVALWLTSVCRQIGVMGYFIPRAIIVFVLLFVPVVQVMVPLIWFLFSAWMLVFVYLDYPADNHAYSFKALKTRIFSNPMLHLGFGVAVLITSLIPLVNFFSIPIAVAGATKLWVTESSPVE